MTKASVLFSLYISLHFTATHCSEQNKPNYQNGEIIEFEGQRLQIINNQFSNSLVPLELAGDETIIYSMLTIEDQQYELNQLLCRIITPTEVSSSESSANATPSPAISQSSSSSNSPSPHLSRKDSSPSNRSFTRRPSSVQTQSQSSSSSSSLIEFVESTTFLYFSNSNNFSNSTSNKKNQKK